MIAPPPPRLRQDLRVAVAWAALAALATVAVFPYLMQVMPGRLDAIPVPLPALIAIQAMQMFIMTALLAWAGLRMGHRVGLGSPLMQRWINRHGAVGVRALRPGHSIVLGVASALAILLLSYLLDPLLLPEPKVAMQDIDGARNALYGLLASFYGGIVEEVQLRLFLMTLLVWGVAQAERLRLPRTMRAQTPHPRPSAALVWTAIVIAALLFGAGHLPTAAGIWGLDAGVVARTVLLNAIGGVAFGWVYWKRGLEMAVLAHFSADLVLHVAVPLLMPQAVL
ncbi:CPBP family intramembrane metalloprotease [Luteimonas sp. BDR2-5]|uniref:CPBP family intramembrane glutamic endopeptidase n=1 Tax=Proluteimonas luteida TaxID=2878685 RepID=UPI001E5C2FDA|nr:CPBP family intramembrane glutamic endopeptidase [Luteimonas sp. BDR2-5]MCD9028155.1 CPBP family intramembrane metalloprotease [Luteimonas sp. BDR2-5]